MRRVPAPGLFTALLLCLAVPYPAGGQQTEEAPSGRSVPPRAQTPGPVTYVMVVTGLGGEPRYAESFHELAVQLLDAAEKAGIPASRLVYLAEDPARDPDRISGRSTRDGVARALEDLSRRVTAEDQLLLLFLGHGSQREGESVLNLPGPDLAGSDLAGLLAALAARRVAVVNAASASGGFVPVLSAQNRIVVTATASPRERNETLFGRHFVRALAEEGADVDKDGRVSLLEAFEYARREVARSYETDNRILTEHALLDDDGDGAGSREPNPGEGDGALAARFFLTSPAGVAATAAPEDPELAALYEERVHIQERISAFRGWKVSLDSAAYESGLEDLLLELARTMRAIREWEGGGG